METVTPNEYLDIDAQFSMSYEIHIMSEIVAYYTICICILGLPGNLLIIKIMKAPPFHETSHGIICVALALSDLYYLIYLLITYMMQIILEYDAYLKLCRIYNACAYLGIHLDAWFVIFLTYERLIAVVWPLKTGQIMTKRRVIIMVIIIVGFYILWDSLYILRYGVSKMQFGNFTFEMCDRINDIGIPEQFFTIHDIISEQRGTWIPLTFIFTGNIIIIYKLYTQKKVRAQLGQGGGNEFAKTNLMVITVTTAFLLLTAPTTIYRIIKNHNEDAYDPTIDLLYIFANTNPAINCYLYFMFGKSFRDQAKIFLSKVICFKPSLTDRQTTNMSTLS